MLGRCLEALSRQTYRDFRTIVVDNASVDGSEQVVPQANLIKADTNLGFAAGNNLGLKHAGDAQWIALLNPDAFPEPDWLERLMTAAAANPAFSFFGCRMLLADTPQFLDGTADVYHVSGLAWRRDHGARAEEGATVPDEIFGPCAAAALYARGALDEVGGFDERYFCYHEDVDLAFRLRLRGHRCRYVPDAVVHHVSSGIAGRRSDFATYHGHRNLVWTYAKDMPALLLWLFLPLHLAMTIVSIAVCAARGQLGVILRAKRDALRGLGAALEQRRSIQAARKVGIGDLVAMMSWRLWRR
jgi:GT2 family glycosyltransferase